MLLYLLLLACLLRRLFVLTLFVKKLRRVLTRHFILECDFNCLLEFTFLYEVDIFEWISHIENNASLYASERLKESANS